MAWTNLLNAIFGLNKPITGATGIALRDNVVAMGNGDAGAPRVQGVALSAFLGAYTVSFAAPVTITGLARHKTLRIDFSRSLASLANLSVAYSSDNGATFGAVQLISAMAAIDSGYFRLDLITGAGRYATQNQNGAVAHTVPANCNAVQFILNVESVVLDIYCLGGVP
jgi:hypothetical protein